MPGWMELRDDLARISERTPGALSSWPSLTGARRQVPVEISLNAGSERIAATLHAKYGDYVDLTLGALTYPAGTLIGRRPALPLLSADSIGLSVEAIDPLTLTSGSSCTVDVHVVNHGSISLSLHTNGHLRSWVVDEEERVVGGFSGWEAAPLVVFEVSPHEIARIPVLIGTTSFDPELGYAIPAGDWRLVVELEVPTGQLRAGLLPLLVTPSDD